MVVGRTRGLGDRARARAPSLHDARLHAMGASSTSARERRERDDAEAPRRARGRRARRRRDARGRRAGATIARRVAVTRAMTRARGATPRVGRRARAMGVDDIARAGERAGRRARARAGDAGEDDGGDAGTGRKP